MQSVFREVSLKFQLKFQFADPAVFVIGQCCKCEFVPVVCVVGHCWKCECFPAVCVLDTAGTVTVFPLLHRALLHQLCQCGHICLVLNQG